MNYVSLAIEMQPFRSKAEMDAAIKGHLGEHGRNLTDTAVEVLRLISQYACKYPGVAFLKNGTIAEKVGKTRRTVINVINRLIEYGIVEKVAVMREKNGGNGANMYVIKADFTPTNSHRTQAEQPTATSDQAKENASQPLSSLNLNNNSLNKRSQPAVSNEHNRPLYRQFKELVALFVPDDKRLLHRLYGAYKGQVKALEGVHTDEELTYVALDSLRAMFSAMKAKHLRNPVGYYSGVVKRKLDGLYERVLAEMYGVEMA